MDYRAPRLPIIIYLAAWAVCTVGIAALGVPFLVALLFGIWPGFVLALPFQFVGGALSAGIEEARSIARINASVGAVDSDPPAILGGPRARGPQAR
jgi:fatty acid desaturase